VVLLPTAALSTLVTYMAESLMFWQRKMESGVISEDTAQAAHEEVGCTELYAASRRSTPLC
jgi:hypothetical protein